MQGRKNMTENYPLMVPGVKSNAHSVEVVSPFNRRKIGTAARADMQTVMHALDNAQGLYKNKEKWIPAWKRIDILERVVKIMEKKFDYQTNK